MVCRKILESLVIMVIPLLTLICAGEPPDIRTCIRVTYLEDDPRIKQLLSPAKTPGIPLDEQASPLEYRYSKNDTDYFSLSPPPRTNSLTEDTSEVKITGRRRSSSSSSKLAKTLLELSIKGNNSANATVSTVKGMSDLIYL